MGIESGLVTNRSSQAEPLSKICWLPGWLLSRDSMSWVNSSREYLTVVIMLLYFIGGPLAMILRPGSVLAVRSI